MKRVRAGLESREASLGKVCSQTQRRDRCRRDGVSNHRKQKVKRGRARERSRRLEGTLKEARACFTFSFHGKSEDRRSDYSRWSRKIDQFFCRMDEHEEVKNV